MDGLLLIYDMMNFFSGNLSGFQIFIRIFYRQMYLAINGADEELLKSYSFLT